MNKEADDEKKKKEDEINKTKASIYDKEKEEFMAILKNYNINSKFTSFEDTEGGAQSDRLMQHLMSKGKANKEGPNDINDIARSIKLNRLSEAHPLYETTK